MTNTLKRRGVSYTVPAVAAVAAQPAYSYFVTETIQLSAPSYSNAPAGWAYRLVTDNEGNSSIQLVYLGTLAPGTGVFTTIPSGGTTTTTRTRRVDVPAVAAVAGSPAYRVDDPPQGWTSFAHSDASIPGAGRAEFRVASDAVGVAIGLSSSGSPTSGYSHIPQGLLFTGGNVKNLRTGSLLGTYTFDDVLEMQLSKTTVSYYKNDVLLASEDSTYAVTPLFLSAVLYAPGDLVDSPLLLPEYGGSSEASLPALVVSASEDNFAQSAAVFPALLVAASVGNRGSGVLPQLMGLASQSAVYAQGLPEFSSLYVLAYGGTLAVELNSGSDTQLPALIGAGLMLVGETGGVQEASLPVLLSIAADHAYGYSASSFPAMYTVGYNEPANEAFLVATVGAAISITSINTLLAVMQDGVVVNASFVSTALLDALMNDTVGVASTWLVQQMLEAAMYSFVHIGDTSGVNGAGSDTWSFNPDSGGSTTYTDYGFNSYAQIGDKFYGADETGLYELDGETDIGEPIRASISLGKRDFGSKTKKTVYGAYLGTAGDGYLYFKVTAEGRSYIYRSRDFNAELQQQRFTFGKGLRTNYVTLELFNEDGADFELDTAEFIVADLTRKI